jgi:hypothetical protein
MVNHKSGPGVDCFQTATELAPEYVLRGIAKAFQVAFGHIIEQRVIRKSTLQLRLPDMVVGIDEARGNDLACAVDCLGTRMGSDGGSDFLDDVPFNEDICVP